MGIAGSPKPLKIIKYSYPNELYNHTPNTTSHIDNTQQYQNRSLDKIDYLFKRYINEVRDVICNPYIDRICIVDGILNDLPSKYSLIQNLKKCTTLNKITSFQHQAYSYLNVIDFLPDVLLYCISSGVRSGIVILGNKNQNICVDITTENNNSSEFTILVIPILELRIFDNYMKVIESFDDLCPILHRLITKEIPIDYRSLLANRIIDPYKIITSVPNKDKELAALQLHIIQTDMSAWQGASIYYSGSMTNITHSHKSHCSIKRKDFDDMSKIPDWKIMQYKTK
ncbi:conserved putative actin superfamily protein [Saccharomycodes ludwigii]|uniref:conserved putative actin superfamily protein n=1 Tax=Saccharomycodes ludwigii TaxID=36035 RepID=UPI001E8C201E|nr:conserved putative actin superfamily protein [Saccharomycodes ludwigii]KAH3901902.1 conserved putative actin superfamily protein [Saccharomycodes ludwigii]